MEKFPQAAERLLAAGLFPAGQGPRRVDPVGEDDLFRVHDRAYAAAIRNDGLAGYDRNRLGLPHHPRLYDRSRLEVEGTRRAALAALEDGMAANLAGGTHHAMANRGLGFCVFNDVAVSIKHLRMDRPHLYIMIVDTDAHQGNGSHALLADDGRTFCYSIHVGRNYPAHKVPGDLDVPLPRWVDGATYLSALQETLDPAFLQFEPDLVFWISGADPHIEDRFGQMRLTDEDIAERDRRVVSPCLRWQVPLVVLFGGGYNRQPGGTGRLHAETVLRAARLFEAGRSG
ncbi:MAG: histone deacetylase family protein [Opitutales bacterium]